MQGTRVGPTWRALADQRSRPRSPRGRGRFPCDGSYGSAVPVVVTAMAVSGGRSKIHPAVPSGRSMACCAESSSCTAMTISWSRPGDREVVVELAACSQSELSVVASRVDPPGRTSATSSGATDAHRSGPASAEVVHLFLLIYSPMAS